MQKIRLDFSGLSPKETDRMICAILRHLQCESSQIHVEILGSSALRPRHQAALSFSPTSVHYVLADRHYCIVSTDAGLRRVRINYCEMKAALPGEDFMECNRGILLRMESIQAAENGAFRMQDGALFPIRTKHRKEIMQQLQRYRRLHT